LLYVMSLQGNWIQAFLLGRTAYVCCHPWLIPNEASNSCCAHLHQRNCRTTLWGA
jgi:hypothetical protein